jgi:ribonuclease P protein component
MANIKGSFGFGRKERLADPQDFKRVMKTGRKVASKNFILFMKENDKKFHRLGVVVSKEVGSATYRNRIKRLSREFFRLHKSRIGGAFDFVILAKRDCRVRKYADVKEELGRVFVLW